MSEKVSNLQRFTVFFFFYILLISTQINVYYNVINLIIHFEVKKNYEKTLSKRLIIN